MFFCRSRFVGLVSLAAFVATFGLPFVASRHHLGDDVDVGWGDEGITLAHPVTQIEQVHPVQPDEHCAICHWVRAFRTSVAADTVFYLPAITPDAIVAAASDSGDTVSLPVGAPRGPPDTP